MKRLAILAAALGAAATPGLALAQNAMHAHTRNYSMVRAEVDATEVDGAAAINWEAAAWYGGDDRKLWLKSEGEVHDGEVEDAELQALLSARVADFWDLQAGVRHDFEPTETSYLVLGVQGLAPYQFETDAAVFISDEGDISLRASQSFDFRLTQRLILEPEAEVNVSFADIPEREIAAGFTDAELSVQLRYEITRKIAPYVQVSYERLLGDTAKLAQAHGERRDETTLRGGLRFWF